MVVDDVGKLGHAQLPLRRRESPPPMCITQMLSAAQSTSDPVATMSAIFSASMAVDGAGFFNAMVPPDPQQDSTPESSTRKWNGPVDRRLESEVFGIAMPIRRWAAAPGTSTAGPWTAASEQWHMLSMPLRSSLPA